jgi:hypothetical protein
MELELIKTDFFFESTRAYIEKIFNVETNELANEE